MRAHRSPLAIGLTGGIGSGKTFVSDQFARLDIPIIDTDIIARELVQPGHSALQEIVSVFGPKCLNADGTLKRDEVRRQVFEEPELRARLEAILHPRIRACVREQVERLQSDYCIVVVPLLVETRMTKLFDRILVVDVEESVQVQRVMRRDNVDAEHARRIISAQATRAQRLEIADDVIDNSRDASALRAAVENLDEKYRTLAGQQLRS